MQGALQVHCRMEDAWLVRITRCELLLVFFGGDCFCRGMITVERSPLRGVFGVVRR